MSVGDQSLRRRRVAEREECVLVRVGGGKRKRGGAASGLQGRRRGKGGERLRPDGVGV